MGRFSKLLQNKGKDITIGDEVFNIKPLTGEYLGTFMEMGDNKNGVIYELIVASLNQSKPDKPVSIEDVKELPLGILTKLMETITEIYELK